MGNGETSSKPSFLAGHPLSSHVTDDITSLRLASMIPMKCCHMSNVVTPLAYSGVG